MINDSRGICPSGYSIPADGEWNQVINSDIKPFKKKHFFENLFSFFGFLKPKIRIEPNSFINSNGMFGLNKKSAFFWTNSPYDKNISYIFHFDFEG